MLISTVQQSESAIYIYIYPLLFGFPSYLGHHRALVEFSVLYSRFSLVIYLSKFPSAEEWIKKMCVYTMEHYSAIKLNKNGTFL